MADGMNANPQNPQTDLGAVAPPHNLDAEQAILGAMLYDNEVYHRLDVPLRAEHFYDPLHGRIYEVLVSLIEKGRLADPVTLYDHFVRDGGLAEIGGPAYLAGLMESAGLSATAPEYARIVRDLAIRRELIRVAGEIAAEAVEGVEAGESAVSQIEAAERKLFSLAEQGSANRGAKAFSHSVREAVEMAAEAYKSDGGLSGIATGFDELDRTLGGLHPSDLLILAGRPSMGKTALAVNIAYQVASHYRGEPDREGRIKPASGGRVLVYSLEMSGAQLALRIVSDASGVGGDRLRRGDLTPQEFGQVKQAAMDISNIPLHIDDTGGISIGQLTAAARRLQRSEGLDMIVVDYLQLVTASNRRSDGRVQEVSEITQGMKAMAKELNVPVIALSQLSRQVENREDKRPQLSDLRESGSIEQDADVVMFVYREAYYTERAEPEAGTDKHFEWQEKMNRIRHRSEVIIGKNRHGPVRTCTLGFQPELTKFYNLEREDKYEITH
jgi:replicative DNA helicase